MILLDCFAMLAMTLELNFPVHERLMLKHQCPSARCACGATVTVRLHFVCLTYLLSLRGVQPRGNPVKPEIKKTPQTGLLLNVF